MTADAGFDASRASCTRLSSIARPRVPATPTIVAIAAGHTDRLGLVRGLRCGIMITGETSNGSSGSGFLITDPANVGGRGLVSGSGTAATCCPVGPGSARGTPPPMSRRGAGAVSIGRTKSGVIFRVGVGDGGFWTSAFGIGPTRNGACGIFGQALFRAKGLSSGSSIMGTASCGRLAALWPDPELTADQDEQIERDGHRFPQPHRDPVAPGGAAASSGNRTSSAPDAEEREPEVNSRHMVGVAANDDYGISDPSDLLRRRRDVLKGREACIVPQQTVTGNASGKQVIIHDGRLGGPRASGAARTQDRRAGMQFSGS